MKKTLFTISMIISSMILFGQNRTYFGMETSVTNDIFEFSDRGNKIKPSIVIGALWGINIRQELNSYFSLGTGIIRNYYSEGYGYNVKGLTNTGIISNSFRSWQIPFRLNSKVNLIKNKIFFTSTIGLHYCINSDYGGIGSSASFISNNVDSILVETISDYGLRKSFPLLETGIGFEIKLFKKVILSFSTSYCTGFKKVVITDLNYTINIDPTRTATFCSKGEYLGFGIQVLYPISELWVKKEQR